MEAERLGTEAPDELLRRRDFLERTAVTALNGGRCDGFLRPGGNDIFSTPTTRRATWASSRTPRRLALAKKGVSNRYFYNVS